jgi:tRNA(Leu) C34 or U34 (ribose-2'-O)-methylase TrmL
MRGYAAVAVDSIKHTCNAGGVIRAAQIYDAALVVFSGQRYKHQGSDAMKGYRHVPVLSVEDVMTVIPYDCVPVAVELLDGAKSLHAYRHPERAFYIFGGEDVTLGKRIVERCKDVVMIPTDGPMNLAACVNVVLYDRLTKQTKVQP